MLKNAKHLLSRLLPVCAIVASLALRPCSGQALLSTGLVGAQPLHSESQRIQSRSEGIAKSPPWAWIWRSRLSKPIEPHAPPSGLAPIDVDLPSDSTGSPTGTLAVRVYTPMHGNARYPEGAPVLVWGAGGFEVKGINHDLPDSADDIIIVTFVYPGGEDPWAGRQSDGVYDYRGPNCIAALRDVILYAAGELSDSQGRTIGDIVPVPVLHDNIGLEGVSNGGNIIVAVAALFGDDLAGHLRYIIQWETPVSSQTATRDLGRVWLQPPNPGQGDFFNPRYLGYGPKVLAVDYSDLTYDPDGSLRQVFHDGNDDGEYTTIEDPVAHLQTPDLNLDGVLDMSEDFPLDTYPYADGVKEVYSRAVTHALADNQIMPHPWPEGIAMPSEADAYWDIREAVWLYDDAMASIPNLEAMVLAGVRDHVQSAPTKPHIQQAFEGWNSNGAWVQINPSPAYLIEADPSLAGRTDLPNRVPNTPPTDWGRVASYCVPEDIYKAAYQLAAVWQMADRVQGVFTPTPAGGELVTYVDSDGDRIAVWIEVPLQPRYPEGAPIVVEVSTWFTPKSGFHRVNETTQIGAVTVSYLWPERMDPDTGAQSEGVYDYGGADSLEVLRDVIRFASGLIPNTDGYYINELVAVTPLTDNVGLFASSHSGVVATNVLAHHGSELPTVKYLVGRENPTRDEMYPLELGHFDDQRNPVYNSFYDEDDYSPTTVTVDYSTVGWYQEDPQSPGRPYFTAGDGLSEHILHETISPTMWGKRYYSRAITQALLDNGALTLGNWPEDLATPTETQADWPFRITVHNYPSFATQAPNLKVMLVFAQDDHVQAAETKPHIHQAWDGFSDTAGLWVRLNPDLAYVQAINPSLVLSKACPEPYRRVEGYGSGFPDNLANSEPADWHNIRPWGFPAGPGAREDVWLASVAEMADRVREDNWDDNLDEVLFEYPPSPQMPHRVYLPLLMKYWFGAPTLITDVTFAVVEGESLALDAYLPATPGPHPAVILIHGGYWQAGDKESHSRLGEWMAEHGYAAFAINYRLAPDSPFPAAVADVQCAVAWVREHAAEYDVDADRIALMGTSAGGHLAALAGLAAVPDSPSASWQPSCGDPAADVSVQAVISCFGPVDLAFHAEESEPAEGIVAVFLGQACQDAPQLCAAASPMTYVTADAPPTLLIHGADDDVVNCENSARLYAALNSVGADVTYLPVEGAQHGFIIGIKTPEAQAAMDAVGDFLAANL